MRHSNGDRVDPADVLDQQEFAEYMAARRHDLPPFQRRRTAPVVTDEYGYDREGRYYPERDLG